MPRLLRQVALTCRFQAYLLWNRYQSWAWTCKLGPPFLGACKKFTHFGPQITPSGKMPTFGIARSWAFAWPANLWKCGLHKLKRGSKFKHSHSVIAIIVCPSYWTSWNRALSTRIDVCLPLLATFVNAVLLWLVQEVEELHLDKRRLRKSTEKSKRRLRKQGRVKPRGQLGRWHPCLPAKTERKHWHDKGTRKLHCAGKQN